MFMNWQRVNGVLYHGPYTKNYSHSKFLVSLTRQAIDFVSSSFVDIYYSRNTAG